MIDWLIYFIVSVVVIKFIAENMDAFVPIAFIAAVAYGLYLMIVGVVGSAM